MDTPRRFEWSVLPNRQPGDDYVTGLSYGLQGNTGTLTIHFETDTPDEVVETAKQLHRDLDLKCFSRNNVEMHCDAGLSNQGTIVVHNVARPQLRQLAGRLNEFEWVHNDVLTEMRRDLMQYDKQENDHRKHRGL